MRWVMVVPVRVPGKTRLRGAFDAATRAALARAMAADTVAACLAASAVGVVGLVSADAAVRAACADPRVRAVDEPAGGGLNAAGRAGASWARTQVPGAGVAVLLGDLPALRAAELDAALGDAARLPRSFVADAAGTGTTLLTVGPGVDLDPRFGAGSAEAHEALGHVRLDAGAGLRHDVDRPEDLPAVAALGVGPRTARLLARLGG